LKSEIDARLKAAREADERDAQAFAAARADVERFVEEINATRRPARVEKALAHLLLSVKNLEAHVAALVERSRGRL
jgi:hypothetical protein